MQFSIVLSIVFASNVYTVDKMVFLAVNLVGIIIGILYEEKRSIKKFKGYKEYMKKVPHRLIPYVFWSVEKLNWNLTKYDYQN